MHMYIRISIWIRKPSLDQESKTKNKQTNKQTNKQAKKSECTEGR